MRLHAPQLDGVIRMLAKRSCERPHCLHSKQRLQPLSRHSHLHILVLACRRRVSLVEEGDQCAPLLWREQHAVRSAAGACSGVTTELLHEVGSHRLPC